MGHNPGILPRGTKYAQRQRMSRARSRPLGGIKRGKQKSPSPGQRGPPGIRTGPDMEPPTGRDKAGKTKKPLPGAERPAWHKDRAGHGAAHWAGGSMGHNPDILPRGTKYAQHQRMSRARSRLLGG